MEKKPKGGAREGAGRKPKADEMKLMEQMDAVMLPESVWLALCGKIESGDTNAMKIWLSYRFGMPKQIVESTNVNIESKELTDEEIKKIKNNLDKSY